MSGGGLQILSGSANRELAEETARLLHHEMGRMVIERFADTESYVRVLSSVRGEDVFIIQSVSPPVNDNLIELMLTIDALRRSSAGRITAVLPYLAYARQERKARGREPISAKVVADMLTGVGAHRVILIDIHAAAMQGFFNIPVDALTLVPTLTSYLKSRQLDNIVIVSPDVGRAKMAEKFSEALDVPLILMHKRRDGATVRTTHVVGDVRGKRPIIVDDIIAGGSVLSQVEPLLDAGALPEIRLAIIHPVLVGDCLQRLADPRIVELITTNSVHVPVEKRMPKLTILSAAPLVAEAIRRTHANESVSPLFQTM